MPPARTGYILVNYGIFWYIIGKFVYIMVGISRCIILYSGILWYIMVYYMGLGGLEPARTGLDSGYI